MLAKNSFNNITEETFTHGKGTKDQFAKLHLRSRLYFRKSKICEDVLNNNSFQIICIFNSIFNYRTAFIAIKVF